MKAAAAALNLPELLLRTSQVLCEERTHFLIEQPLQVHISARVRRIVHGGSVACPQLELLSRHERRELWREREQRGRPLARRCVREVVREKARARRRAASTSEQVAREVVRHVFFGKHLVVGVRAVRESAQVHCLRLENRTPTRTHDMTTITYMFGIYSTVQCILCTSTTGTVV